MVQGSLLWRSMLWPVLLVWPLVLAGCLAQGDCLSQEDCDQGKICRQGTCTFECQQDDECQDRYECRDHRCTVLAGCQGCFFANAASDCDAASCEMGACLANYHNLDLSTKNGCEYFCVSTQEATESEAFCDGVDDDCDGVLDEGFDLLNDILNCGLCGKVCPSPEHATPTCLIGDCRYDCLEGWYDNNGEAFDGCESIECVPTSPPVDVEPLCDNLDDDCDGTVDEGHDKTRVETCGTHCLDCKKMVANGSAACEAGACEITSCDTGYVDVDRSPANGCECEVLGTGEEICNDRDDDCNGFVDDGLNCCPADMVQVDPLPDCLAAVTRPFCIDRYEATLWSSPDCDGNGTSYGTKGNDYDCGGPDTAYPTQIYDYPAGFPVDVGDTGLETQKVYACSLPGLRPSRCVSFYQARRACENSGKRLCSADEWTLACKGGGCTVYPYGDTFTWDICNYLMTWGTGGYHLLPTASMEDCFTTQGVYDISGNIWEMDDTGNGFLRGGAFNCNEAGAPVLESCENAADFTSSMLGGDGRPTGYRNNAGFRCCQ